jgi:hypothetical protein
MYLTGLHIEGFRGAEQWSHEGSSRLIALPKGRIGCAIADAISLFGAGFGGTGLLALAQRLGWAGPETTVVGQGSDAELQGLRAPAVAAVVTPGARTVTIEGVLALDPPLFGQLREHAARDPRMVTALGQKPSVRIKVGWLFSKDRTNAHASVLFLRVGDVAFELAGKDRPMWVPELLTDVGRRFARTDPFEGPAEVAKRWVEATISPDPIVRQGLNKAITSLRAEPFGLPAPGLLQSGASHGDIEVVFGEELSRVRQLGRFAHDALRITYAAYVLRPDVLVVDELISAELKDWFLALTEADDAPVEQIWHG